jgi:iron complex outermembrane receptor protein
MVKHLSTKTLLLLAILFWGSMSAFAQTGQVTGTVTDAGDGTTLPGASVVVKGTVTGTVTDINGKYSISVSPNATLVFSFVGYESQEVLVQPNTVVNVPLQMQSTALSELVVIGYGVQKKGDATGSVSVIGSKDFNQGAITTPQQLLAGKSAGVVITSSSGAPGSGSTIRIRGGSSMSASNDPLIVVDGVPLDNVGISGMSNPLSVVNPNDIETFTVLKDASATAIYGSRASNGVIMITTKKGKAGSKLKLSYNGYLSMGVAPKFVDVLSGDEFRQLASDKFGTNNIDSAGLARLGTANTDWQSEIYRSAISQDHNISATGSYKTMPYRFSYGYTNEQGILENTDMKRNSLTLNLNPTFLNDDLKVNINAKGSFSKNNFGNDGAVGSAVRFDPTQPVMNGNSRYAGYYTWTMDGTPNGEYNQMATSNPVAQIDLTDNQSKVNRYIANGQFDYRLPFLPDLHANLNLAIDQYSSSGHNNADTTAMWTRRAGFGQLIDYNQEGYTKTLDFTLNYKKDLDAIKSKIEVMGGYSWQHFYRKGDNYQRSIVNESHPLIVADSSNYATENFLVSFFGRINYSLMDRYLVTFTLRDDGSSRFSEDNRWGLFPSVALAWKLKNESFFKDVDALYDLKLRLGWGQTGQQNINNGDYPYMGTYRISQPSAYYQFGGTWYPTLRPNAYDPNIKWETTTTQNIGIDFSFLEDRVSGSFDLYNRVTDDLINFIPIPNGSNFSNYLTTNVGSLENNGYEIALNFKPISNKEVVWDFGFNLSYNQNEITKLTRTDDPNYMGVATGGISGGTGNNIQIQSVGYPTNSFFVLQQVYGSNGMPLEGLYVDLSGQGGNVAGNLANFYHYKKPAADYMMGINTRLDYRNWDFALSGRVSIGNYVYNNVASQTFYGNLYNNSFWQNMTSQIENTEFNNAQYFSDLYVENASFFKMDYMSAGYSFDKLITEKLSGRVSFTVQNAFTITKYKGLDPEVDGGIDNNFYPRARIFLLGLNVDF